MSGKNQIKDIFQGVVVKCPIEITQYGKCLVISKEKDSLGYHTCNEEFTRLLKCFQKVSDLETFTDDKSFFFTDP
jgi:hypothetical protein